MKKIKEKKEERERRKEKKNNEGKTILWERNMEECETDIGEEEQTEAMKC